MSLDSGFNKKRQIIPRWHLYSTAKGMGLTKAIGPLSEVKFYSSFSKALLSWKKNKSLIFASDLIGNALAVNNINEPEIVDAANFILKNKREASILLREMAEGYISLSQRRITTLNISLPKDQSYYHSQIHDIKSRVREYPRNPILWMDLAFLYSVLGQSDSAEKAVDVALSLSKTNRYLLRSGSRFFLHVGESEKALRLLRKNAITKTDPWLIAAEIAISDSLNLVSKNIPLAKKMIESGRYSNFHLSELAGAFGTIELKSGSTKKAKKLFSTALRDPTENTLAQATSLQEDLGKIYVDMKLENFPNAFEAETVLSFSNQEYPRSLEASKRWFAYQPFSARPAQAGSYIAGVALGKFDESIEIAKLGLVSSPDDFYLKNNLAFSFASLDKIQEAKDVMGKIEYSMLDSRQINILKATEGLVEMRSGNLELGRKLYEDAIEGFKKQKELKSETIAKFFLAREERRLGSDKAEGLIEEVCANAQMLGLNELLVAAKKTTMEKDKSEQISLS